MGGIHFCNVTSLIIEDRGTSIGSPNFQLTSLTRDMKQVINNAIASSLARPRSGSRDASVECGAATTVSAVVARL